MRAKKQNNRRAGALPAGQTNKAGESPLKQRQRSRKEKPAAAHRRPRTPRGGRLHTCGQKHQHGHTEPKRQRALRPTTRTATAPRARRQQPGRAMAARKAHEQRRRRPGQSANHSSRAGGERSRAEPGKLGDTEHLGGGERRTHQSRSAGGARGENWSACGHTGQKSRASGKARGGTRTGAAETER